MAQVGYIARNARRCALLANRTDRPRSTTTPLLLSTTGMMAAMHAMRR